VHLNKKKLYGWIGSICLLLIIPIKAFRWANLSSGFSFWVGITPSLLGPAGLFFLILSGEGWLSRKPPYVVAGIVAFIAFSLEFIQLLPRPGLLSHVHYTFDWFDILASALSVAIGYLTVIIISKKTD
jgi:hypothetical protein